MRSNFEAALAVVRRWEGGLVDHPSDPGGITKWGISLRFLRGIGFDVNGDGVVDGRDIRQLTEEQVSDLYRGNFWDICRCDDLPAGVDLIVFDCAVNQGPGRSTRLLQKSVGARADGNIGPKTMAAIRRKTEWGTHGVIEEFSARRAVHYSSLRNVIVFGLGWFRRLANVQTQAVLLDF